jgi:anti-anti-sigma factor
MSRSQVEVLPPHGDVSIVRLHDEIDIANTSSIFDLLAEAVPNDRVGMTIDLSGLRYIDSAGVRMLFSIARRLDQSRQALALAVPADCPIARLVKITRLDEVAFVGETLDDCLPGLRRLIEERY